MEAQFHDWISFLIRAAHIVAAIGWIGSSFYFMALDYSLRHDPDLPKGVKGESWSVHGGGFYQIRKYSVAPEKMPTVLHWYKWEAYSTWLTGFMMLAVTYWWGAEGLLIDRSVADVPVGLAVAVSAGSLFVGWILYDQLCKSPLKANPPLLFAVLYAAIVLICWLYGQVFSARAAWLHTGALIATMMSGNVFMVIIPNQKKVVEVLKQGGDPDPRYGEIAKLRSTHNNYLTLPVIAMMVSNHYPMAFGHPSNWVIVAFILAIGGIVRHFFNSHDMGKHDWAVRWQLPTASLLFIVMMWFSSWRPDQVQADLEPQRAMAIVATHCSVCHAQTPRHDGFDEAPGGVMFDTLDQIRAHAPKMLAQAVMSNIMPLGNETGMMPEERAVLGAWLRAGAPQD
ncbi:urate hydroxylase PuuD [Albimonas sp. CAU 1670]|uniref:urate hydroxylase PuuD n=1 Tax=Albimonas sp. CAU 1670 TaxID=3032599 RepID=UPI0023D9EC25|nr:urate hydroxylase PuuD [Albimonas sp. CAU 1670]MDF2232660.1 urate hydroxylase PuuD [Albimonas sp. CAU 1670]